MGVSNGTHLNRINPLSCFSAPRNKYICLKVSKRNIEICCSQLTKTIGLTDSLAQATMQKLWSKPPFLSRSTIAEPLSVEDDVCNSVSDTTSKKCSNASMVSLCIAEDVLLSLDFLGKFCEFMAFLYFLLLMSPTCTSIFASRRALVCNHQLCPRAAQTCFLNSYTAAENAANSHPSFDVTLYADWPYGPCYSEV